MPDQEPQPADIFRQAKARLQAGRTKIAAQHAAGQSGWATSAAMCDLFFGILLDFWDAATHAAMEKFPEASGRITLVPTGGLGRRDVAPYSDLDVMILHEAGDDDRVAELSQRLLQDVFDTGLQLSLSVRTIKQACALAGKDAEILSSLTDARYVAGSISLFREFLDAFQVRLRKRRKLLRQMVLDAREAERERFGGTVFLLEPDVKRSRGGLRDVQLLRWVAGVWYGNAEPKDLVKDEHLSEADRLALSNSAEHLLRIRHDMHFAAKASHDLLDRSEQLRLSNDSGAADTDGLRPVEVFMRDYFFHTERIGRLVTSFVDSTEPTRKVPAMLSRIFTQHVSGDYRIEPTQITATPQGQQRLSDSLAEVIRLCGIATTYGKKISQETSKAVQKGISEAGHLQVDEQTSADFIALLDQPVRLGQALRMLHDLHALELIIPEFAHARGLLQFNAYHKYTVDEHCLRAVGAAAEFTSDTTTLGRVYRGLPRKYLLHLALLIHDLGKGYGEDHSDVGARIAEQTAATLRLEPADADALRFLVHKHLLMSHTAFRRDTSDSQLVLQFAFDVGSPDLLQMLYVMTAADFQAVGPGVLNEWKVDVLTALYARTMSHLMGDSPTPIEQLRAARTSIRAEFAEDETDAWIDRQIDVLPSTYLNAHSAEEIAMDLAILKDLEPGKVFTKGDTRDEVGTLEFRVGVRDPQPKDTLSRLSGALSGKGIQIHSVDSHPLLDGRVVYWFQLEDPQAHGLSVEGRIEELDEELRKSVADPAYKPTAAKRVWRTAASKRADAMNVRPVQVKADNDTSPNYTILDIFAPDQLALFYRVAKALESFKLRVGLAKMSAYLDQALGVFYVTDRKGRKIEDAFQLQAIRTKLVKRLESPQESSPARADGSDD